MGSISLNGNNQIGMAYSISSSSEYPGIRFCGQSEVEYEAASGVMDIAEEVIHTGANSQSGINRWGDYADLCVDPDNDRAFWFTSQYIGSGGSRRTKIASFEFDIQGVMASFSASNQNPCENSTVDFMDESTGAPVSWWWSFQGGDPAISTEQNPAVTYPVPGEYDVQLVVSNSTTSDTIIKQNFIHVLTMPEQPSSPTGPENICSGDNHAQYFTSATPNAITYNWVILPPEAGTFSGSDTVGTLAVAEDYTGEAFVKVQSVNDCGSSIFSDSLLVNIFQGPSQFNMVYDGGFCEGEEGFEVTLDGSQNNISYELFRDESTTGIIVPGNGEILSFGYQAIPGIYTIVAHGDNCSIRMNDSTNVYFLPAVGLAATPSGPGEVCNSENNTEFQTAGAVHAINYIWHLNPALAGTISGSSTTGTVDWSPDFSGDALVLVQGTNDCGPGTISEGWPVEVIAAPHPEIAGQSMVCSAVTGNLYFYSTAQNPENEYFWTISSGNLVTGQGTHKVFVTWTGLGEGSITVTESAPTGCTTVADTLHTTIFDCTGIKEQVVDEVLLYPNPVKDEMTVKCLLDKPGLLILVLYDHMGKQVLSKDIRADNSELEIYLPVTELMAGAYTVKIYSESGKTFIGKFIKTP
jgi:PKD repeat protein